MQYLLENGANLEHRDERGATVLSYAAKGDLATVKYLHKKGLDIDSKDLDGLTPLFCTLRCFKGLLILGSLLEVIKYLVENGADVNTKD